MNIFFLDSDLEKSAASHVDRHAGKMLLEACQLLASCYPGTAPYKITHKNHPMAVWARESLDNTKYVIAYAKALAKEFTFRREKVHKSEAVADWYATNLPDIPSKGFTDPPRCFGELKGIIEETSCVYTDYRRYYSMGKTHLFSWSKRNKPEWIK